MSLEATALLIRGFLAIVDEISCRLFQKYRRCPMANQSRGPQIIKRHHRRAEHQHAELLEARKFPNPPIIGNRSSANRVVSHAAEARQW